MYYTFILGLFCFCLKNQLGSVALSGLISNGCLKRLHSKCTKLQLQRVCRSMKYKFKPLHDRWLYRSYVRWNVIYTGGCAKIQEETLPIEIEDHRQPLCIRLLSQLINKVGSDSHIISLIV